jgi:hypothetical protein
MLRCCGVLVQTMESGVIPLEGSQRSNRLDSHDVLGRNGRGFRLHGDTDVIQLGRSPHHRSVTDTITGVNDFARRRIRKSEVLSYSHNSIQFPVVKNFLSKSLRAKFHPRGRIQEKPPMGVFLGGVNTGQ